MRDCIPNHQHSMKMANPTAIDHFERFPMTMIASQSTAPMAMPTGPVHAMPIKSPKSAMTQPAMSADPFLGTLAMRYIQMIPQGIAATACVHQARSVLMLNTIAMAIQTINVNNPKMASRRMSLAVSPLDDAVGALAPFVVALLVIRSPFS